MLAKAAALKKKQEHFDNPKETSTSKVSSAPSVATLMEVDDVPNAGTSKSTSSQALKDDIVERFSNASRFLGN